MSDSDSFATPRTVARQAPLSIEFPRQEYWSGLPFPSLGDLPDPGTEPTFLTSLSLAGGFSTTSTTWEDLESIDGQLFGYSALVPTHVVPGRLTPRQSYPTEERERWLSARFAFREILATFEQEVL